MIGEKLKKLRKQKGFSMEYAAEKINVSRQTVAKWENGESLPEILKCKELASLYGISPDGLVAEKEEAGDQLVVLSDIARGMAIVKADTINEWKDY